MLKLNYPRDKLEVIVVNDGSTDSTRAKVDGFIRKSKRVILINQKNQGKAAALNKGLKMAKGEFFVCLDADSVVTPEALNQLLPYFDNPKVALALPLMKAKKPSNLLQKVQFREYLINIFLKKLLGYLDCIHVAPGPFSIYRKSVLERVGGFEVGNITEDLEMTLRIQKYNYKIVQDMHAEVFTSTPKNWRSYYRQRSRWNRGGIINGLKYRDLLFNKEYGDFGLIQAPVLLLSGLLAMIMFSSIIYYLIKPNLPHLLNLSLVNFDILPFIMNWKLNFTMLDLSFPKVTIFFVMLFFTSFTLYLSHRFTKEKVSSKGALSLVFYLFFYFLLLGFVWFGIVKDFITTKEISW
ncbi:hypothetical protein A3K72_01830 [Candidatus Woesearchaeota archaeon RBG_13_36_6]|nr:MAG: hypothetical protein A3K72_01830 [Candidatus Woesearchaeota archaeon RBG_13_36_6]